MISLLMCLLLLCCAACILNGIFLHSVIIPVLATLLALFLVYLILLSCRKGHPAWARLGQFRYAHRGLHDLSQGIPENSLAAFCRAVDQGFGAELDVHLMADGELAVVHDSDLTRVCGKKVRIEDLTAADLKDCPLLGTEETIPLFRDVLPIFVGKTPLIVELKVEGNAAALAEAACKLLDQYQVDYCIESFHPMALRWLAKNRPEICRGQLSQNFLRDSEVGSLGRPARLVLTWLLSSFLTQPDFIAYHYKDRACLSLRLMKRLYGIREVGWTIRDRTDMERLEAEGVIPIFEGFIP